MTIPKRSYSTIEGAHLAFGRQAGRAGGCLTEAGILGCIASGTSTLRPVKLPPKVGTIGR